MAQVAAHRHVLEEPSGRQLDLSLDRPERLDPGPRTPGRSLRKTDRELVPGATDQPVACVDQAEQDRLHDVVGQVEASRGPRLGRRGHPSVDAPYGARRLALVVE